MGNWCEWSQDEKDLALEMYADNKKYKDIAFALNKSMNAVQGFIKRSKVRRKKDSRCNNGSKLPEDQLALRIKCHSDGLLDSVAAKICGITTSGYNTWRRSAGLVNNGMGKGYVIDKALLGPVIPKKQVEEKRKALKPEDIRHYRHNDNTKIHNSEKILMKVEINPVIGDLSEPTLKRSDGPKASDMGMLIIGSKWIDKNHITARQETYANTVRKLVCHG